MNDTISEDGSEPRKKHDVDTGFAWIVLIGSFMVNLLLLGSAKAFRVLYTEMVEYYSSGSGNTAWIGTIAIILMFSLGIGYGLTYAPCMTIISYYFDKRRSFANGITVSGSGVGAMSLPFLYKYLIDQYGLKGTFWIIGAIFANVSVAACTFRQPGYLIADQKERIRAQNSSDEYNVSDGQSTNRRCAALDLWFSLFKNVLFTLYVISFMFCAFGYSATLILIPASVQTLGYDTKYVALSLTIYGGVEVVARILIGLFADLNIIKHKYIYAISMFIGGSFCLLAPLFENFSFIAAYATIAATFPGSYSSLVSILLIYVVGLENLSPAFGLVSLSLAAASLPSQPAVDWLYDVYGNWHVSFILTGCMYILAGITILLEPIVVRYCTRTGNNESRLPNNLQQRQNQGGPTDGACKDDVESTDTSFTYKF